MSPKPRKPGDIRPYTISEIAKELGVDRSTAHKMLVRGDIPYHWNERHTRRLVKVSDWHAWRERNR